MDAGTIDYTARGIYSLYLEAVSLGLGLSLLGVGLIQGYIGRRRRAKAERDSAGLEKITQANSLPR